MRFFKNTSKNIPPSPFTEGRARYEAFVPLLPTFRFVHEPIGMISTTRFVGRQSEMEALAERILFSEGGSFLVTGYRGVGKTSFINQVIKKLEEALPWAETFLGKTEIVDIYLNVARPVQPSEIMHHIIRQLHDRLIEKGIYHLLDGNLKDALTLAYYRTSVNMARKLAESSERNFGFNEASIGGDWVKAAVKMSWSSKRSRTQNYEMSFLGYDDKSAEHDIITISRRLLEGYIRRLSWWERLTQTFSDVQPSRVRLKIVFVFDELDKLEEFTPKSDGEQKPAIDHILGALKNLFTTSGVTFIFIAGKDLQERWLEDVGRGDSVYESVFSYDKYLPCLWADVNTICDGLIDMSSKLKPYSNQVFTEFKKYLAYKGRGIPRRIIRTFNEYVEWNGEQPVLAFTRQNIRNIRFFAGLQDILIENEKQLFGDFHEEAVGTQSDKRRLGVYYLIDWILRQGSAEFTLRNVLYASKRLSAKIALAEEIASNVAEEIIKILLDNDYVEEVQRPRDNVVIGDAEVLREDRTLVEKRYRIAPRRLGEMAGLAAEIEIDAAESMLLDRSDALITSIGRYKIIRTVARGGMGAVYEATDENNGRKIAIKVMLEKTWDTNILARFEREALIMNQLNHPNVIRLYDWGNDNGRSYIAMEYLDGITLHDMLRRMGRLSLHVAAAIVLPITEAVDYVHQKGFVRNDIKPSNVMLTNTGRVCLLDFGITKPLHPTTELKSNFETLGSQIIGTPAFMAPEQFQGRVDGRSDIYSLGIMLYEMLTGVLPFKNSNLVDLMQAHAAQLPTPPSQVVQLPPEVDALTLKCIEKIPGKRFQNMKEVAIALRGIVRDLPPADLKSVIAATQLEIRGIEKMDRMPTEAPTLPDLHLGSLDAVSLHQPDIRLILDEASTGVDSESTLIKRPRFTLVSGRTEDVYFHGMAVELSYPLEKKTSIGRNSENDIVLRDEKVSRYHAELTVNDQTWFIEDFNSSLGTAVNGEKIAARQPLNDGDEVRIGDFLFVFNEAKMVA